MKVGIFDSGLGGLLIAQSLSRDLPQYDYVYFGDTAHVPYGNRSQEKIYQLTTEALKFLFEQNCQLVIIACNTASAEALRRVQQVYVPDHFPDRKVLGVLIPAAEAAVLQSRSKKIGVLATVSTVMSQAFVREIKKISGEAAVFQEAAPLLVPLVENNALKWAPPILREYLRPLLQHDIDTLILGCTHYPFLKQEVRTIVGEDMVIIAQDEIIPTKLREYLARHPEIESLLSKNAAREFFVTDITEGTKTLAYTLFHDTLNLKHISLS